MATLLLLAAYGAAMAATLVLARYLTPAAWWRRPTLRGLAIVGVGTWAIGGWLHGAWQAAAPPAAHATRATAAPAAPPELRAFRVKRDLNLRAAPETASVRLAVVPAGALVTATGQRHHDWWQISTMVEGRKLTGWSSSLWLRRQEE